ncbi:MAG: hypothetical protein AAGL98_00220 [Planctomycetota bacterium]
MRVTIIKDDNAVNIDGTRRYVDCSSLPADFHALQWNDAAGEIEYARMTCAHCGGHSKKANELITDLAPYQPYVDAWKAEDVRVRAEEAAAAEAARKAQHEAEHDAA